MKKSDAFPGTYYPRLAEKEEEGNVKEGRSY